jgi:chloride channel protein, CIC family
MKQLLTFFQRLKSRLSAQQYLVLSATLVGISAGVLAVGLKLIVHGIQTIFNTSQLFSPLKDPFYLVLPTIGIGICVLFVDKILKGDLGRGVANVLFEIARKSAHVKRHKLYSHIVTSALTAGFGGSAGLEAPIVVTGSAVGSNLATTMGHSYRERTLLLGCGAAAGIAAVFNAPIAGVMFAMEVLLADVTISAFIPLIISAACGALFSRAVLNESSLFSFKLQQPFNWINTPFYVILGIFCAFISLYYVRTAHTISTFFKNARLSVYQKALLGGVILALLIAFFPSLFGEGYSSIRLLADGKADVLLQKSAFSDFIPQNLSKKTFLGFNTEGSFLLAFLGATIFIKAIATAVTLGSGGNGGNFAPSLFVGSYVGFFFSRFINTVFNLKLTESNFTIVGMAGILSGVMYAPLTAIFLIAEVAGGYDLIIPLMIVSTISSVFVRHFEPISIETKAMIARGEVFSQDKDRNILLLLKANHLIETDFKTIEPSHSLGELIETIKISKRNLFAVVGKNGRFEGILTLDDVRSVMFDVSLYDTILVEDLMKIPPAVLRLNEDMGAVMKKFDDTQAWNLPVVDESGAYVGFISKSAIFSNYRNQLISMNSEG